MNELSPEILKRMYIYFNDGFGSHKMACIMVPLSIKTNMVTDDCWLGKVSPPALDGEDT